MSIETHEEILKTDAAIAEAEAEYARTGELYDAEDAFEYPKRKHFG